MAALLNVVCFNIACPWGWVGVGDGLALRHFGR